MADYDLVIFDFDGTLADSLAWFWNIVPEITETFRLRPLDPAQRDAYREMSARAMMSQMGVRWWQAPFIARYVRRRLNAQAGAIALFAGIPEMLARLRGSGVRLAIVSTNSRSNVVRILGSDAAAHVDHFGCGAPILGKKRRTQQAIRAAGTTPARTLCIGDELRDADVALAVGATFAPVAWGYTLPSAFRAAGFDTPLSSPDEIVRRVTGRCDRTQSLDEFRDIEEPAS